jgi:hypothetical protein
MSKLKRSAKVLLGSAGMFQQRVQNWHSARQWRQHRTRPLLNVDRATWHVDRRVPDAKVSAERGGSIHVRIVFHYVPHRLPFLAETMAAAAGLPFDEVDLWIDTNTPDLIPEISRLPYAHKVQVWENLDHPFKLTWVHRTAMVDKLDKFDAFLYVEDDILIPRRSMQMWLRETPRLAPHGLLPGFVRVEEGRDQTLYLSDYIKSVSSDCLREIDGRPYLSTPYPYQACWVYDAAHMQEMAATPGYLSGAVEEKDLPLFERDGPPQMREQVALGLQFTAIPVGYESRSLVPLTDDLQVAPDALVFHAPCNYTNARPPHPAGLGQLPLTRILERP